MSWWSAAPALVMAGGVLLVPGAVLATALGLRGIARAGVAPVLSVSVSAVSAIVASGLGIRWNVLVVLVATALASVFFFVLQRRFLSWFPKPEATRDPLSVLLAAAVGGLAGAVLIARRLIQLIGAPTDFEQGFDNVFHLNAIRYILNTGDASTLTLGKMSGNSGGAAIYPAAWHGLAALVSQLSGASVPVSENALNIMVASLVWPLGCIFLARVVLGPKVICVLSAGVLAAASPAFPYLLMVWGPLFPNMLSISMVPTVIALLVIAFGFARRPPVSSHRAWLCFGLSMPGLVLAHPSSLHVLIALCLPLGLWKLGYVIGNARRGRYSRRRLILMSVGPVAVAGIALVIWLKLRPVYNGWGPHTSVAGGIGEGVFNAPLGDGVAWALSLLAIVGAVWLIARRIQPWLVLGQLVAIALYVVDAGVARGGVRAFFTGPWYQDTNRLAALLPIFETVLASAGVSLLLTWVWESVKRQDGLATKALAVLNQKPRLSAAGSLVLLAFLLMVVTQGSALKGYVRSSQKYYAINADSAIISADEYALLSRLDRSVPPSAVIADNPWNGSSLAYALSDRRVLRYHMFDTDTPDADAIVKNLNHAASMPAVCQAVHAAHVSYVLDFGSRYLAPDPEAKQYQGLEELDRSDAVQLIDSEGDAKLYKIVACS